MGHSHAPRSEKEQQLLDDRARPARRRAGYILAAILIPLSLVTGIAMIALWPTGDTGDLLVYDPYSTTSGVSMHTGQVQSTREGPCPVPEGAEASPVERQCAIAQTQPDDGGPAIDIEIGPEVAESPGVHPGDRIRYLDLSQTVQTGASEYLFIDFVRTAPMLAIAAVYALVVIIVARWRGFRALIGLVGAFAILASFILPALLEGRPPLLVALVGSIAIMIGVLYFAHGVSARTSTALLGTIFGLAITAGLAAWATSATYLTGLSDESNFGLLGLGGNFTLQGIILCGLIISGLGVLNDVTITQSSAVWELYEIAPDTSAARLFSGAMRIGRDHIASTVYTIAFAYAGAALPVLLLLSLYDRSLIDTFTSGEVAEEVVRTLVGSIGLVLAIPVTTGIAVLVVKATGVRSLRGERQTTTKTPRDSPSSPRPKGSKNGSNKSSKNSQNKKPRSGSSETIGA